MTAVAYTTTVRGQVARVERVGRRHRVTLRDAVGWEVEYWIDADRSCEARSLLGLEIEASVLIAKGRRRILSLRRFEETNFLDAMLLIREALAHTDLDAEKMLAELEE